MGYHEGRAGKACTWRAVVRPRGFSFSTKVTNDEHYDEQDRRRSDFSREGIRGLQGTR